MTLARRHQISLNDTRYYHCISRCVRRAFLCGYDALTRRNLDHRKKWLVNRFHQLSSAFAIRICAYSVMSNHYHLVLFVDTEQASAWDEEEVNDRWSMIFKSGKVKPNGITVDGLNEKDMSSTEIKRQRLQSISWFMRCLNENIARKANREDQCKGRFWEGRFKSQALVGEEAILACMTYVDLNPLRAGLVKTPEEAPFTSLWERLQDHPSDAKQEKPKTKSTRHYNKKTCQSPRLLPFREQPAGNDKSIDPHVTPTLPLSVTFSDYLELLDWTGRYLSTGGKAVISNEQSPILQRLKINHNGWFQSVTRFEGRFCRVAGRLEKLREIGQKLGVKWLKGQRLALQLFLYET